MNLVVVESPAKAKTINKYLGANYKVLASFGHVRDLPSKNGSVKPDDNFAMVWESEARSEKHIQEIAKALKETDTLYLATDPDREGEAISWHIQEILKERKKLKGINVQRIVFNEITKSAIQAAIKNPRPLNQELIDAYLARRALDYLVGFTLSPILWRKLPGSRSAGRVQSVALRLITDREGEIERFISQEYWTIKGHFLSPEQKDIFASLTHFQGKKLGKLDIQSAKQAEETLKAINPLSYTIETIEKKRTQRHPTPPFITSTLQQEASRKLGFSTSKTMSIAQQLYEGVEIEGETQGLITYMRTDSIQIAQEALIACRAYLEKVYGAPYVPTEPRVYKTKAKNAQEAHEAIRPTDVKRKPQDLSKNLTPDQLKLYDLIWKRALASQMASAQIDQVALQIASPQKEALFRATGSTLAFDGFLKLYEEGQDNREEETESKLPVAQEGAPLKTKEITSHQHFTQPPPRFSEASLVKKLEELGIGRPSTYAPTLKLLQDRQYVRLENRVFIPEERGRIVIAFLVHYFQKYVEYSFTAELEHQLDEVSAGQLNWQEVLKKFWQNFSHTVDETKPLTITAVIEMLEEELKDHLFPKSDEKDPRACPKCDSGRLHLKLSKFGAFIGCSAYPTCTYTKSLSVSDTSEEKVLAENPYPKALGKDPKTQGEVSLRKGPYGFYLQLDGSEKTPKRAPLPKNMSPQDVTLEKAVALLNLPRLLGNHPQDNAPLLIGIGRFGPYIKHGSQFVSLPKEEDLFKVTLERAVEIIELKSHKEKRTYKKSS